MQTQEARVLQAEHSAAADREQTLAELLKLRSVDAMRRDAHVREVKALMVGPSFLQKRSAGQGHTGAYPVVHF
jgi:riboflavin synthase